MEVQLS